jgi:HAE1 family hydrophobic/amphiphilic exporter-1
LLVSQALTLFTTPVIYLYLDRVSAWITNWGRSAQREKAGRDQLTQQAAE